MSLLNDIRSQSHAVRLALFVLATFVTASAVGIVWFTDIERRMFLAFHEDPAEQEAFLARQASRIPAPIAAIGGILSSLPARIGDFIGVDEEAGFDRSAEDDTVYPLPIVR
jgi:hypothetical protein